MSLVAKDWPTFGGIFRNHSSNEEGLRTKWNGKEPDILWKIDIGLGYSSVVEHRGKAISQGYENGRNTLFCLDAEKGTVLWKHQYPCKKAPDYFQGGTRATPTVHEDKVYILSHEGDLYALDLENGKVEWSVNVVADLAGERPQWGFAGAPLVVDDKVIVQKGGKKDLWLLWRHRPEVWFGRQVLKVRVMLLHTLGRIIRKLLFSINLA